MSFLAVLHELCLRRERHPATRALELIRTGGSRGLGRRVHRFVVFHQLSFGLEAHSTGRTLVLLSESKNHVYRRLLSRI